MIDPRPYTYEFRKPRLNNPTFQSSSVYDSMYHMRIPSKNDMVFIQPKELINERRTQASYEPAQRNQYNPESRHNQVSKFVEAQQSNHRQAERNQSLDQRNTLLPEIKQQHGRSLERDINQRFSSNEPYPLNRVNANQNTRIQSHLSNYGQNLMKSQTFDRFSIFQKQQKGYNIINCYPKSMSSSLRVFPKLTLENKLIENARYYNN